MLLFQIEMEAIFQLNPELVPKKTIQQQVRQETGH